MANRRFIDFPIASTVGDSDIILIWQSGANKQTTKATFLSGLPENLDELNDVAISGLTNGQILRYDSVTGKWENTDQGNLDLNDLNDVSIVSPSNGQVLVYNSSTSKWENSSGGFVPYVGAVTTVDLGAQGLRAGYVRFDTTVAGVPNEQGLMFWDADDETVDIILNGYTMKIGEDLFYPVKNQTGSTIAKGVAVRFNGTVGASGRLLIAPFIADGSVPSSRFMGVTAEEILNGEDGKVLYFGRVRGINTNAFNEGDILYASTTVAGGYQTAIPVAPNNIVQVAAVVTKSATVGTIFVRPTLGSNINKDEGVKITSVADKNLLQYQSGTALWENKTLAQVLGGTSSQFVKGDGSLDSTSYQPLLTNPVTGTGTTNYLPKFTGSTTIGNSATQTDATGNLMVGSANAGNAGTINVSVGVAGATAGGIQLWAATNQTHYIQFGDGTTGAQVYAGYLGYAHSTDSLLFGTNGADKMVLFSSGNLLVGIGSDTGERLQVSGNIKTNSGYIQIVNATNPSLYINNTAVQWQYYLKSNYNIAFSDAVRDVLTLGYNGSPSFFQGGNVGIGTASPAYKLVLESASTTYASSPSVAFYDTVVTADARNWMIGNIATDYGSFNIASSTTQGGVPQTPRFTINRNGNVGIGTASPNVNGLSTALTINGSSTSGLEINANSVNQGYLIASTSAMILNARTNIPLLFYTNDTERMRITSGGNLLIGTQTDAVGVRLRVEGGAIRSLSTYDNTSATAANLVVSSGGTFERSTSSLKYKKEVRDYDKGLEVLKNMRPVYYKGKSQSDGNKQFAGLIAEEVHDLGLNEFVQYANDGTPDALAYTHMIALLINSIKELKQEIDTLKN